MRHCAYLIESRRVEGRPRQLVVCYIGSITDHQLKDLSKRHHFWEMGRIRLSHHELDAGQQARCEAAIAAVVPPLTDEERAQMEEKIAHARTVLSALRAMR